MPHDGIRLTIVIACFLVSIEVARDDSWRGGYRAPQLFSFPPGNDIIILSDIIIKESKYSNKAVTYSYANDNTILLEFMQSKLEGRGLLAVILYRFSVLLLLTL